MERKQVEAVDCDMSTAILLLFVRQRDCGLVALNRDAIALVLPRVKFALNLSLPDGMSNSSHCPSYNSYNVSSQNLVFDHPLIPLTFFIILITFLFDIVMIL